MVIDQVVYAYIENSLEDVIGEGLGLRVGRILRSRSGLRNGPRPEIGHDWDWGNTTDAVKVTATARGTRGRGACL